jgi:hypothetical protein
VLTGDKGEIVQKNALRYRWFRLMEKDTKVDRNV